MELSSSNIKKIIIFSQKKAFLISYQKKDSVVFSKMKACTFWSQPSKFFLKKIIFFLEKIYCFLKRKLFLYSAK